MAGNVVRVSNLPANCQEADILEVLTNFGPVSYIKIEDGGVALVEFEESHSARVCLTSSVQGGILILGQPIYVTASQLPGITRESKLESALPTNCLILFVLNATKQITPKVVRVISERVAPVVRIAIHKEDVVFALVEFKSPDEARRVKHQLNGCDIYSGCCTLKIEFANLSRVKVQPGEPTCYDSTPHAVPQRPARPGLLVDENDADSYHQHGNFPPGGQYPRDGPPPGHDRDRMSPGRFPHQGPPVNGPDPYYNRGGPPPPHDRGGPPRDGPRIPIPNGTGADMEDGVVMIFNVEPSKTNCDTLFNICCLLGNVNRILFLKNKQNIALVQMGDNIAAQRVIKYLGRCVLFGKQLNIKPANQARITLNGEPSELPDGTLSYREYLGNRNNRFPDIDAASRNRLVEPRATLYWSNAPFDITEKEMSELFTSSGCAAPKISILRNKLGDHAKIIAGMAEFDTIEEATDAVALCNHKKLGREKDTKFSGFNGIKMSFVSTQEAPTGTTDGLFPGPPIPPRNIVGDRFRDRHYRDGPPPPQHPNGPPPPPHFRPPNDYGNRSPPRGGGMPPPGYHGPPPPQHYSNGGPPPFPGGPPPPQGPGGPPPMHPGMPPPMRPPPQQHHPDGPPGGFPLRPHMDNGPPPPRNMVPPHHMHHGGPPPPYHGGDYNGGMRDRSPIRGGPPPQRFPPPGPFQR